MRRRPLVSGETTPVFIFLLLSSSHKIESEEQYRESFTDEGVIKDLNCNMAPGILSEPGSATFTSTASKQSNNNTHAPRNIFPDGIRTSGQLDPIVELLRPFEDFPSEIQGPTVWTKDDYIDNSTWTHRFTEQEIAELSKTSDDFIARGTPLTGVSQVSCHHTFSGLY